MAQLPGVHVADGDEVARAGEGEHLAPEARFVRNGDRAVHFGQADVALAAVRQPVTRARLVFVGEIHNFD